MKHTSSLALPRTVHIRQHVVIYVSILPPRRIARAALEMRRCYLVIQSKPPLEPKTDKTSPRHLTLLWDHTFPG